MYAISRPLSCIMILEAQLESNITFKWTGFESYFADEKFRNLPSRATSDLHKYKLVRDWLDIDTIIETYVRWPRNIVLPKLTNWLVRVISTIYKRWKVIHIFSDDYLRALTDICTRAFADGKPFTNYISWNSIASHNLILQSLVRFYFREAVLKRWLGIFEA